MGLELVQPQQVEPLAFFITVPIGCQKNSNCESQYFYSFQDFSGSRQLLMDYGYAMKFKGRQFFFNPVIFLLHIYGYSSINMHCSFIHSFIAVQLYVKKSVKNSNLKKKKLKSVAYSSQGSHTSQLDFCN